jgi:hypothetical protein
MHFLPLGRSISKIVRLGTTETHKFKTFKRKEKKGRKNGKERKRKEERKRTEKKGKEERKRRKETEI